MQQYNPYHSFSSKSVSQNYSNLHPQNDLSPLDSSITILSNINPLSNSLITSQNSVKESIEHREVKEE